MEKTSTPDIAEKKPAVPGKNKKRLSLKFKKPKPLVIIVVIVVVLILATLFFAKGLFVAATVNGSPVSRLSVIRELEKQGGKQTLESIISKNLIEAELKKQNISVTPADVDEEIRSIEAQATSQGGTLSEALAAQGRTEESLREQITLQKGVEKLLADKTAVSDEDIDTYLKTNKPLPPKDMPIEDFRKQVGDQLQQQKFQQEAQKWIADLKAKSKIQYFVTY